MNSIALENFLARLYTDSDAREDFLADPENAARAAGISEADAKSLLAIDRTGLLMAADSYAHKRKQHRLPKKSMLQWLTEWTKRL